MDTQCCCSKSAVNPPGTGKPWITGTVSTQAGTVCIASSRWSAGDRYGAFRCRVGGFRTTYTVEPGLYGIGTPTGASPVFVSANYKLSFDHLRRGLHGVDGWILVLDTRGINVWCAAGKGTFGTDELVNRIEKSRLDTVVEHRKVIVPQLGAPGVAAHEIRKTTGFSVIYGPVRANDITSFLSAGMKAPPAMRRVTFSIIDRLVLTPMELRPSLEKFLPTTGVCLALIGLERSGVLFSPIVHTGIPLFVAAVIALLTGTVITPLLLPFIPFRAFSLKGFFTGLTAMALYIPLSTITDPVLVLLSILFFPAFSSFGALNFTGSTPYTGISGVKREMKIAVPLYVAASVIGALLLLLYKIRELFFSGGIA